VSNFIAEIYCSLRRGVNRGHHFTFDCRTDVFRFLFGGKGRECPQKFGRFYELEDFDEQYFPSRWYITYDRLGSGCEIEFPVRLHNKIKLSPPVYDMSEDGSILQRKRSFKEVCNAWVIKKRC